MLGFWRAGSGILDPKRRGDGLSLPRRSAAGARARTKPSSELRRGQEAPRACPFPTGRLGSSKEKNTNENAAAVTDTCAVAASSTYAFLSRLISTCQSELSLRPMVSGSAVRRLLHFRPRRRSSAQDE